jgi:hypothetical protein
MTTSSGVWQQFFPVNRPTFAATLLHASSVSEQRSKWWITGLPGGQNNPPKHTPDHSITSSHPAKLNMARSES